MTDPYSFFEFVEHSEEVFEIPDPGFPPEELSTMEEGDRGDRYDVVSADDPFEIAVFDIDVAEFHAPEPLLLKTVEFPAHRPACRIPKGQEVDADQTIPPDSPFKLFSEHDNQIISAQEMRVCCFSARSLSA